MLQSGTLKGKITATGILTGRIAAIGTLKGKLAMPTGGGTFYDEYTGDYVITPKTEAQTMATQSKVMTKDVTIKSIPYYETSNTAGGETVYIGIEVI